MIWKKIDDYDYSINELAQIRNDLTGRILKNQMNDKGYFNIVLFKDGKKKHFRIHRLLCKCFKDDFSDELFVDHINKDKLDNRLENLRMVTKAQNNKNRDSYKDSSSKYKGVYFDKNNNKWKASITINYKQIYIGRYQTELEAAQAYNNYIDQNNLQYYSKNNPF
jgi:hypothetical protein